MTQANIHYIPAGLPFTDTLAKGLLTQYKENPVKLSQINIYLPNRRSCRTLSESFLKLTNGQVTILPRMIPIGDMDLDDLLLSDLLPNLSITEPIQPLSRQFLLAQMIMARGDLDLSYDQAIRLAVDLGRLIDQVHAYDLNAENLASLVPEEFAEHWKITLDFLSIIIQTLPDILREKNLCNPSEYRNRLLDLKSELFKNTPPKNPIIAAGATGTIPATAQFLITIAQMPTGSLILPGLDQHLDEESWDSLDQSHPQYALKNLLDLADSPRSAVKKWPFIEKSDQQNPKTNHIIQARQSLISEVMRPATTSHKWYELTLDPLCVDGITNIVAENPQEEAQIIALMMREVLETPQKTAMLVTPDRDLARRVATNLKRWQVDIDDSAGIPLSKTVLGHFLTLIARMLDHQHHTVLLLEMLKHSFCQFGDKKVAYNDSITLFEKEIMRGPRLDNIDAIKQKIDHLKESENRKRLKTLITEIENTFSIVWNKKEEIFSNWIDHHIMIAETLGMPDTLWRDEMGEAAATLFSDLKNSIHWHPAMTASGYADIIETLMSQITIRPRYQKHPRLKILSPIEGQLQSADLMIMSGLNEGVWPISQNHDPWMSRPMRQQFGLPSLERQIGLSAHNFCQHFASPRVILTRCQMNDGAQTVPSRWLLRLETVLKQAKTPPLSGAYPYQILAQEIDYTDTTTPCEQPHPTPPVAVRPLKLSATEIETWIRDPYSIYAKHVLKLRKLKEIEEDEESRDWGTYVHHVLEVFTNQQHDINKKDILKILLRIADQHLEEKTLRPEQHKQWRSKFEHIAEWFIDYERTNSAVLKRLGERSGTITINDFTLTGRVDRLDLCCDNKMQIIDYKTGSVPTKTAVKKGYAPQLSLMGLIAENGGFGEGKEFNIAQLSYYKFSGKKEKPADVITFSDPETLIQKSKEHLLKLIEAFSKIDTPYWSIPNFAVKPTYNDYEHLARIQEWSANDETGDDI